MQETVFTRYRRRPRAEVRLRARAEDAEEAPHLGDQVERHRDHHAVLGRARGGDGEELSRREVGQVPHRHSLRAVRAQARPLQRRGRVEPVRRHSLRPRSGLHRHDRHCAGRQHQSGAQVPFRVRAGARLGAGHRRTGHCQSDRADLVGRHDARPSRRAGSRGRDRQGDRAGAGRSEDAHARSRRHARIRSRPARRWPRFSPEQMAASPIPLSKARAKRIWLRAQRLDEAAPFGGGPDATPAAVAHLGYVQIDTINVVERCHHQILYTRIPDYRREHLRQAQSVDKSVFEYWTHALSYIPTADMRFFVRAMKQEDGGRSLTFSLVKPRRPAQGAGPHSPQRSAHDPRHRRRRAGGKNPEWASRKPSKRALQLAFFRGIVTVSRREGMLKTYELTTRHFGWDRLPKAGLDKRAHRLSARSRAAVAGRGQPRLDLPSRCAAQGGDPQGYRRTRAPQGTGAGRARRRRHEHWASPEMLDATLDPRREYRPHPQSVRSARHPAQAPGELLRLRASLRGLCAEGEARVRLLRAAGAGWRRDRRGARSQDGSRAGEAPGAEMDLAEQGRPRAARKRQIEDALHRFERFQLAR